MAHRIRFNARKALLAAATVLALATAACGSDKGGSTGPSDPPPPPPPTSTKATLRVNNQTTDIIAQVRIRLCSIGDFGVNLIGTNSIQGGTSRDIEVPTGCYDVGVWSSPAVDKDAYKSGVIFVAGAVKQLNLPVWP
jgi:hypothetical protein